jgi:parafibromin
MSLSDGLLLLRSTIASSSLPSLTTTADVNTAESNQTDSLALATHLYFSSPLPQCLPLSGSTRFISTTPDTTAVDLRSIYFAWIKKDVPVNEYIALAQDLDGQLPEGERIRNLVFVERLDLITWLEGASDDSEYIKALEGPDAGSADIATKAADVAGGAGVPTIPGAGISVVQQTGVGGRPVKVIDARLQEIYNGERLMGDRNSVLRGIKPTVSSICRNVICACENNEASGSFIDQRSPPRRTSLTSGKLLRRFSADTASHLLDSQLVPVSL